MQKLAYNNLSKERQRMVRRRYFFVRHIKKIGHANFAFTGLPSVLHLASSFTPIDTRLVAYMLSKRAKPNKFGTDKNTPFHITCKNPTLTESTITEMLRYKADPNIKCGDTKSTPLHHLCENPNISLKMIELMLSHRANPNLFDCYQMTPFAVLCSNPKATHQMITYMLEHGAGANHSEIEESNAFHYYMASPIVNLETINAMHKHGADFNNRGGLDMKSTPFHRLCSNSHTTVEMLRLSLDMGADPTAADMFGLPAIFHLCLNVNATVEMFRVIYAANPIDAEFVDNLDYMNLLYHLMRYSNLSLDIIEFVIEKFDHEVNTLGSYATHPLLGLCENPNVTMEAIELLLKNGADLNMTDSFGITPFIRLVMNSGVTEELIQSLLDREMVDIFAVTTRGSTASHSLWGNTNLSDSYKIELYKKNEIDLNEPDFTSWTPLTSAVSGKIISPTIIKFLFDNGAIPICQSFRILCGNKRVTTELLSLFLENRPTGLKYGTLELPPMEMLPLQELCCNPRVTLEMVAMLLRYNEDPNKQNRKGRTTLFTLTRVCLELYRAHRRTWRLHYH